MNGIIAYSGDQCDEAMDVSLTFAATYIIYSSGNLPQSPKIPSKHTALKLSTGHSSVSTYQQWACAVHKIRVYVLPLKKVKLNLRREPS